MRMEHLRYLIEIDRHHSISAAAQALYLSQTTLSAIVRGVERELGFPVFTRTHNGVQTTAEGEEALALIWEILSRYEEILCLGGPDTSPRPVPILLSPTINEALSLPLSRLFLEQEPAGNLEFHTGVGDEIGTRIINNEGNIGITYYTRPHLEEYLAVASKYQVEVEILCRDRLYLLMRRDHPLAGRTSIPVEALHNLNFAILDHFNTQEDSIAHARYLGSGNRYTTFPNVTLLKQAVRRDNVVSILGGFAIQHGCESCGGELLGVPLTGTREENQILMCLIHRQDQSVRYQEKVAVQCIKTYFETLDWKEGPPQGAGEAEAPLR